MNELTPVNQALAAKGAVAMTKAGYEAAKIALAVADWSKSDSWRESLADVTAVIFFLSDETARTAEGRKVTAWCEKASGGHTAVRLARMISVLPSSGEIDREAYGQVLAEAVAEAQPSVFALERAFRKLERGKWLPPIDDVLWAIEHEECRARQLLKATDADAREEMLAFLTERRDRLLQKRDEDRKQLLQAITDTERELEYTNEAERDGFVGRYSSERLRCSVERQREKLAAMDAEKAKVDSGQVDIGELSVIDPDEVPEIRGCSERVPLASLGAVSVAVHNDMPVG